MYVGPVVFVMATRRTLLGHAVALAAGGFLATGTAAGRSHESQHASPTTLSFTVDTTILTTTGIPETVAPRVSTLTRRYDSVSVTDLQTLSGRVQFGGTEVTAGHTLATGAFDAEGIRTELRESNPRFQATASQAQSTSSTSEDVTRFVDTDAGETIELTDTRLSIARGRPEVTAMQSRRGEMASPGLAPTGQSTTDELAAVLGGNAVALGTLAQPAKQYLSRRLSHLSDPAHTVLSGLEGAGIGIRVGQSETQLRYALAVDGAATEADFEAVVDEFSSNSAVSITDTVFDQSRWLVDGSVSTASLWDTHEQFLGLRST